MITKMEHFKPSKPAIVTSWVMSSLVVLFLSFDATIKFLKLEPVIQSTIHELGYKEHHIFIHGLLVLVPTILYVLPKTAVLGAVLLTALFGGAIASHLRVDNPVFSHTLFPVYVALLMWGALWLRNQNLRNLFPIIKLR